MALPSVLSASADRSCLVFGERTAGDFHQQLEAIEGNVVALFALVAEDLAVATEALLNSDAGAVHIVAERHATVGDTR